MKFTQFFNSIWVLLLFSPVCFSANYQSIEIQFPSSLHDSEMIIYKQAENSIEFGNLLMKNNNINISRHLASLKQSNSINGTYKTVSLAFSDIKRKISTKEIFLNEDSYNLFFVSVYDLSDGCGLSTVKSSSHNFAVIAFDPIGICSSTHILTHEIGHIDGMRHDGEFGGSICNDGSLSVMKGGVFGNRKFVAGSYNCKSGRDNTPYSLFKKLEKTVKHTEPKQIVKHHVSEQEGRVCGVRGLLVSICVEDSSLVKSDLKQLVVMSGEINSKDFFLINPITNGDHLSVKLNLDQKNRFYKGARKVKVYSF